MNKKSQCQKFQEFYTQHHASVFNHCEEDDYLNWVNYMADCNNRSDRPFGQRVIWTQHQHLKRSLTSLKKKKGLTQTYILTSEEEVAAVKIDRQPTWTNKKHEKGPFDIIGDIHGCYDELRQLIEKLGYVIEKDERYKLTHPEGRHLVFVGDLVDRGPNSPEVLRLVMDGVASGIAFCVNGNHDDKLKRHLMGRKVQITHGLQETLDQLAKKPEAFKEDALAFLKGLISHYVFDGGKLAVAHAGVKEAYLGRGSPRIQAFCLYGETTGEIDEFGLPIRYPWAEDYRGETLIVYGHTPISQPEWVNNTLNIDTGCVFGGRLTALRYPEKELVSVKAAKVYSKPIRPLSSEKQACSQKSMPVHKSIEDYKLSPFHILAHENALNMDKDHFWHLD